MRKYVLRKSKHQIKCNYFQTIENNLLYCKEIKAIWALWEQMETWLHNQIDIKFNLTVCKVLFCIPFSTNEYIQLINFVIILSKWYINS